MAQKRLGDLLLEAGLITAEQLQSAITHQKIAKGRLGSNLVALGFITEDTLMDFLGQQLGVSKVDVRGLDIPEDLLRRIPRRMAEQYLVLPVGFKEPKTLVLAMADPMDLNAVDSARFATGLNIETVVAAHSAMKGAIAEQYRKVQEAQPTTYTVGNLDEGLPVNFNFEPVDVKSSGAPPRPPPFKPDPFFDEVQLQAASNGVTIPLANLDQLPELDLTILSAPRPAPAAAVGTVTGSGIVPGRTLGAPPQRLEAYRDHTLLMGLIKLLQRRGIFTTEDLQRTLAFMVESGEVPDDRGRNSGQAM
ncbi:MAG TPA: hypothetical protein VFT46_04860 [Holophagaceae bacterium]|nr:hypothetical protein [Holophagaceae bacterium]